MATPTNPAELASELRKLNTMMRRMENRLSELYADMQKNLRPADRFVSMREAAEITGLSESQIRRLSREGRLDCIKEPGQTGVYRYSYVKLQDYVYSVMHPAAPRIGRPPILG